MSKRNSNHVCLQSGIKNMFLLFMILLLIPSMKVSAATVTLKANDIVNHVNGLAGTNNSKRAGLCLKWVFDQYKALGAKDAKIGKSCNCAYEAGSVLIQSSSRDDIPLGTLVFFGGNSKQGKCSCGHYYGHVGIYVGNDQVVSIHGNGKIKKEAISSWENWGYKYRGWGNPKNVIIQQEEELVYVGPTVTVITIPGDTTPPVITDVQVTNITADGYLVSCTVTDDCALNKVQFPTWTEENGQDDLIWHDGVKDGNVYSYQVKTSEHNQEHGSYITHIYAWDNAGNQACADAGTRRLENDKPVVSDIVIKDQTENGYTVQCIVTDESEIKDVQFLTWTTSQGQDDLKTESYASKDGNVFTYYVDKSSHNNELGSYNTEIHAYDILGNETSVNATGSGVELSNRESIAEKVNNIKQKVEQVKEKVIAVKNGYSFTYGDAQYKVVSAKKHTLSYVKPIQSDSIVVIPDSIDIDGAQYKVTSIAKNAFKKNQKIDTVMIGKNVKTIGKSAFEKCRNLKSIQFNGTSLKTIKKRAFKSISKEWEVTAPSTTNKKKYTKMIKKSM